ncbi:MAG TPA: hypothetical protein VFA46_17790 [Actinomycetes bacterium]|nr:hypothetical protein [Actinomycetes bacterium]
MVTLLSSIPGSPGLPVLWWGAWLAGGFILFWGLVWLFQRLATTWEQEIWREHQHEQGRDSTATTGSGRSGAPEPVTPAEQPGLRPPGGGDARLGDR